MNEFVKFNYSLPEESREILIFDDWNTMVYCGYYELGELFLYSSGGTLETQMITRDLGWRYIDTSEFVLVENSNEKE